MQEPSWTERLLDAARTESAVDTAGVLWSFIAHDLRAPLAAIQGYAGLLDGGRAGPLSSRQQEFVTSLAGEVRCLQERLECVLAACRLLHAAQPADRPAGDLRALVTGALGPLADVAAAGALVLSADVDEARGQVTVQVDGADQAAEADLDAIMLAVGLALERCGGRRTAQVAAAGQRRLVLSLPGHDPAPDPAK